MPSHRELEMIQSPLACTVSGANANASVSFLSFVFTTLPLSAIRLDGLISLTDCYSDCIMKILQTRKFTNRGKPAVEDLV